MFLQSNDAVVPDTHATVGYDESVSDGPLSFRLFILLLICPYQTQMVGARIVILHKVTVNINQLINREDISVTYRVCIDVSSYAKSPKTVDLSYVIIDLLQLLEKWDTDS